MSSNDQSRTQTLAALQAASFWIDESGTVLSAGKCFVVAGIKTRRPDELQREIQAVRDRHQYSRELKFGRIQAGNFNVIRDVVEVLGASEAHIAATVIDGANPAGRGKAAWQAHGAIVSQLVIGNTNKNEIVTVQMDGISTPPGKSVGGLVKRTVNRRLSPHTVVQAVTLDSKSNDLLQVADLVAGAIRHMRMAGRKGAATSREKALIASQLAIEFGTHGFADGRNARSNILTLADRSGSRANLRVVSTRRRPAS